MLKTLSLLTVTFFSLNSFAGSLYDVKVNDVRIYDIFKNEGVPEGALQRSFEFLDINAGKTIKVKNKFREKTRTYIGDREVTIKNESLAIIDFSKPSSEKRLFVMNLKTGDITKHFVAHGKGSGVNVATRFSNIDGSKMSSLGIYVAGNSYFGGHGESMNLYGLEPSNDKAAERDIVMHAAGYVSEEFVKAQGRLGRSWGCPAVAPTLMPRMLTKFKDGGVIFAYHKDLTPKAVKEANLQEVNTDQIEEDIDLPDEEEGIRKSRKTERTDDSNKITRK